MTIESIRIENFQSHKGSDIELHPGVNVFVGQSDSGKSVVVRALRWLAMNKPGGDAFRSNWGGDTIVSAVLDDGAEVARIRTKKLNQYVIERDGAEVVYEAFGSTPPEDVLQLLNVSDINFQWQIDAPFLLSESPGQVAQYLNRVSQLDMIDTALQRIGKWTRELEGRTKSLTERRDQLEESLAQYDNLPDFEKAVEALELEQVNLELRQTDRGRLAEHVAALRRIDRKAEKLAPLLDVRTALDKALALHDDVAELTGRRDRLKALVGKHRRLSDELAHADELQELLPAVDDALRLLDERDAIAKRADKLTSLIASVSQLGHKLDKLCAQLDNMHQQFHDAMGSTCILCESKLQTGS